MNKNGDQKSFDAITISRNPVDAKAEVLNLGYNYGITIEFIKGRKIKKVLDFRPKKAYNSL